jgi:hypothetical protein
MIDDQPIDLAAIRAALAAKNAPPEYGSGSTVPQDSWADMQVRFNGKLVELVTLLASRLAALEDRIIR